MLDKQITNKGFFIWRYPTKNPIDIHNQAQGIISLSKMNHLIKSSKLDKLLNNTIKSFWNPKKKYFYYQKWSFLTNKINYIRWSQGWMFYAITKYYLSQTKITK